MNLSIVSFAFISFEWWISIVNKENRIWRFLLPFGNSIVSLTFIVHIPNDHFSIQFAEIACQMRSNATTTSGYQHHLSGNILQNYNNKKTIWN